jgi:hypothetical protein
MLDSPAQKGWLHSYTSANGLVPPEPPRVARLPE